MWWEYFFVSGYIGFETFRCSNVHLALDELERSPAQPLELLLAIRIVASLLVQAVLLPHQASPDLHLPLLD